MILSLAIKSLRSRKFNALLVVISIALSVALLLGVERIREQSLKGFARSISGTDLIVGSRTGSVNLLLYSVFHVGSVGSNVSLEGYEFLAEQDAVSWAVPIVLGDSHRGYPLVGTSDQFYTKVRYGRNQPLSLERGKWFSNDREVVLGAEAARSLGYDLGSELVIAHGGGDVTFIEHDEHPFIVSGILDQTGTPVDQAIHSSLAGIEGLHADFYSHQESPDPVGQAEDTDPLSADIQSHDHEEGHEAGHEKGHEEGHEAGHEEGHEDTHRHEGHLEYDGEFSAVLLGLKSRPAALFLQREINEYEGEPLSAILPGVALQELWSVIGYVEAGLFAISILVIAIGLVGMFIALMSSLEQRRREMAIFRAVGASPLHVMGLIVVEAVVLTLAAIAVGVCLVTILHTIAQPIMLEMSGLYLEIEMISGREWVLLCAVALAGTLVSIIPAYRIYRYSLADGITFRF